MYAKTPANFPLEIIHECLKWFVLCGHARWEDLRQKLFTASAVCHPWNDVVQGNSEYWTQISLQHCTKPSYTKFFIDNAKSGPITLVVDLSTHDCDYRSSAEVFRGRCMTLSRFLSATLPLLRTAFPRVQSIHFEADEERDIVASMAVLGRYGGTSVRTATFLSSRSSVRASAFTTEVESTPVLTRLLTRLVRPLAFGVGIYKALTDLTILTIQPGASVTQTELAAVLRACEALQVLQLVNVDCVDEFDGPSVVMSHVRRLRVEYDRDGTVDVLSHLMFPVLEELSVHSGYYARIETITNGAPRIFHKPTHVSVYSAHASLAALVDVMLVARHALTLDFRRSTFADHPFEPAEDPFEMEVALQLSKLESIWLPANIPFSTFRLLGTSISYTAPAVGVRLVTEAVMDLGEDDDYQWEFCGKSASATAVTLPEDDGEWMDPCNAGGNAW